MKCAICGISIDSLEEAIEQDWIPRLYEGDEQHGPACAGCSECLLRMADDGEMEVRGEYRGKIIYQDEMYDEDDPDDRTDLILGFILN